MDGHLLKKSIIIDTLTLERRLILFLNKTSLRTFVWLLTRIFVKLMTYNQSKLSNREGLIYLRDEKKKYVLKNKKIWKILFLDPVYLNESISTNKVI